MRNWSGQVEFSGTELRTPTSTTELQLLIAGSHRIRAIGTAHSFNDFADTSGIHVSLAGLSSDISIDDRQEVAWIPAGMRYGDAARVLDERGLAFHNMASLGHISVGGSVATGTHGSGDRNPTLAAMVYGIEMVTATGDIVTITHEQNPELLPGVIVGLGAVGVVTKVAVRVQPRFEIRQYVFDGINRETLASSFDAIFSAAYSVSYFTTWDDRGDGQVWMKRRTGVDAPWSDTKWLGGTVATEKKHPLPGHDALHCTEQGGVVGAWHDRLPHFRLDFTPSSGDELQTEYLLPRGSIASVLRELETLAPKIAPVLHVSEVRTMCADDLWLSGAYGRDTVGIHFTWRTVPEVKQVLPALEELLGGHAGRPHWGKLYAADPARIRSRYARFDEFVTLAERMDPEHKFRNPALDALLS